MSATATMPKTVEEGYDKVKNLIFDQVHKFRRRYGGDMDDLVGEANMAFVKGHQACVEGKNNAVYPTEIRRWVWFTLFDTMRVRLERERSVKFTSTAEHEDLYAGPITSSFDCNEFVEGLTEDARATTLLVLNPPPAIEKVAMAKGGTPRNYRSTVRAHLRAESGWSTERINAAFEEIAEVLNE